MELYIIHKIDYENFEILGIFDNEQKAEELAKQYKMYCDSKANIYVEKYILNQFTQDTIQKILSSLDKLKNELLGEK